MNTKGFWEDIDECEMCGKKETEKKEINECPHCEDMYCPAHFKPSEHGCYAVVDSEE